jgi:hypothetical protein
MRLDQQKPAYRKLVTEAAALGSPLLTAIVRRLDCSHPRRLSVLGDVAAGYSPRSEVVRVLARTASDRRNSDNRRMGAVTVLNQYLGIPPAGDFLSSLRNPALTVVNSLVGTLNERAHERDMLRDYVGALQAQPLDVLYTVLGTLAQVPGDGALAALRLLGLHPDPELMHGAIEALAAHPSPRATGTLAVLEPNLPPDQARTVSRHLRKLRLSGAHGPYLLAAPHAECRALISAIDGHGVRVLWFRMPAGYGALEPVLVCIVIRDTAGVVDASFSSGQYVPHFPPPSPLGKLHTPLAHRIPGGTPNRATVTCVEVPFAHGLRVLRSAVAQNWAAGTPLPIDYQLSFDMIWKYGAPLGNGAPRGDGGGRDEETLPEVAAAEDAAPADGHDGLLANPLFESWYLESSALYAAAQDLLGSDIGLPGRLTDESWHAMLPVLIRLARSEFGVDVRKLYAGRLKAMAQWLLAAGQERDARLAASAACTMLASPPEANLFVVALVQKGLLVALQSLTEGPNFGPEPYSWTSP